MGCVAAYLEDEETETALTRSQVLAARGLAPVPSGPPAVDATRAAVAALDTSPDVSQAPTLAAVPVAGTKPQPQQRSCVVCGQVVKRPACATCSPGCASRRRERLSGPDQAGPVTVPSLIGSDADAVQPPAGDAGPSYGAASALAGFLGTDGMASVLGAFVGAGLTLTVRADGVEVVVTR
jgi:hypothetical protein